MNNFIETANLLELECEGVREHRLESRHVEPEIVACLHEKVLHAEIGYRSELYFFLSVISLTFSQDNVTNFFPTITCKKESLNRTSSF